MKASLHYLHHQDSDWMRELEFYKEEISILTSRLEEVIKNNTDKDIAAQVEHFQNKFVILREQVDVLHHDIGVREKGVTEIAETKPEHIDEKFSKVRDTTLNRMKDLADSFADTRFDFNRFLAKVM
jgi:predicted RNA-binding protein